MRIGYSHWGFLGAGIVDTPDGGRSHRTGLLDGLATLGHEVVLLQRNRDLEEAGDDLTAQYRWDSGLPPLDALMLEWRWPIPPRNTSPCRTPGHTCDLHRQAELLHHYTYGRHTPTLLWDKDLQLACGDPLRRLPNVRVLVASLRPPLGMGTLLFPVADHALDVAWERLPELIALPRPRTLIYVGNQYDRDEDFERFFAHPARHACHAVFGKWPHRQRWPHVQFQGRIAFPQVDDEYQHSLATALLLPARYQQAGQMTQRVFEAVLAGCLPITPTSGGSSAWFTPPYLQAATGTEVLNLLGELRRLQGTHAHAELLGDCLHQLGHCRLSQQLPRLALALDSLT